MTITNWYNKLMSYTLNDIEIIWQSLDDIGPDDIINDMSGDDWMQLVYSVLSIKKYT